MTNDKLDFEGTLKDFEDWLSDCDFQGYVGEAYASNIQAIQAALRLAIRMQEGDITEEMLMVGDRELPFAHDVFTAMSKELLKEVCDANK